MIPSCNVARRRRKSADRSSGSVVGKETWRGKKSGDWKNGSNSNAGRWKGRCVGWNEKPGDLLRYPSTTPVSSAEHGSRNAAAPPPPPPEPVRLPPRSSSPSKSLMNCRYPLAITIRLRHETLVLSYLNGELAEALLPQLERYGYSQVVIPRVWLEVLQHTLDAEGNTVLHYISYFESTELLDEYLMQPGPYFSNALLTKKRRGQVPADFCAHANDPAFKERIDTAASRGTRSA